MLEPGKALSHVNWKDMSGNQTVLMKDERVPHSFDGESSNLSEYSLLPNTGRSEISSYVMPLTKHKTSEFSPYDKLTDFRCRSKNLFHLGRK